MLNFCDFIQVFVFTRNHHLKWCSNSYLKMPTIVIGAGKCYYDDEIIVIIGDVCSRISLQNDSNC